MADGEFLGMRCRNIQRSAVRGVKLKFAGGTIGTRGGGFVVVIWTVCSKI